MTFINPKVFVYCLLSIVYCLLSIAYCQLPVAYCLLIGVEGCQLIQAATNLLLLLSRYLDEIISLIVLLYTFPSTHETISR